MFYSWLKWNVDDMGWFFSLKLSEPTLINIVHGQEEAFKTPPSIMDSEELTYMYQDNFDAQCNRIWTRQQA
jgi:hypothetical protein